MWIDDFLLILGAGYLPMQVNGQKLQYFLLKFHVSTDISLKEHNYVLKENKVHKEAFKEKDYVTVSCQTNIDLQQMNDVIKNLSMLRADNKTIQNKLNNKPALK